MKIFRLFIALILICFALSPRAQAVVPPPDGEYPNFNAAEGQNALFSLTTGAANTAVGWYSLFTDTAGSFNTGLGAGTLVLNTGDENTAVGTAALLLNTATGNTAIGSRALLNNTTGGMLANFPGFDVGPNVAVGQQALESNTVASANTAVGYQALHSFATGPVGLEQLGLCTAVGFQALANTNGNGAGNSAFGYQALMNATDGGGNTAVGLEALFSNTIGNLNTAIGNTALPANTIGNSNTAIGGGALPNNISGSSNTALGSVAGDAVTTASHVICIGASGENLSNSCYIGNIFGATSSGGSAVFVNANGKLGTSTSSRRFKDKIEPIGNASEAILALRPVSFHYKKDIDPQGIPEFGLVAEEVEKVNPALVIRDTEGKPYTVRYEQVNAMLLNEFLKEHRKVEKLEATVAQQYKDFEAAVADLKGQIQKVSAQLELNKPAQQTALNNR